MAQFIINYQPADGQRFAAALGQVLQLVDTQTPPQPRAATAAECKAWLIGRAWQVIVDVEGPPLQQQALATVSVPPVSMT